MNPWPIISQPAWEALARERPEWFSWARVRSKWKRNCNFSGHASVYPTRDEPKTSWIGFLEELAWLTRCGGQLLLMRAVRCLNSAGIGAITQSAKWDFIRQLQTKGFDLQNNDCKGSIRMTVGLRGVQHQTHVGLAMSVWCADWILTKL